MKRELSNKYLAPKSDAQWGGQAREPHWRAVNRQMAYPKPREQISLPRKNMGQWAEQLGENRILWSLKMTEKEWSQRSSKIIESSLRKKKREKESSGRSRKQQCKGMQKYPAE